MTDDISESGSVFTLKRLWTEDPDLCCGSGRHYKVLGKLSEVDLEPLGVLEVVLGQGIEVGKGLFLEHSERRTDVVHVFLDDSEPVSVGHGFVVVAVAGHFYFYFMN
jgi:hypothetical protein